MRTEDFVEKCMCVFLLSASITLLGILVLEVATCIICGCAS
jgi:hypothetical protein